MENIALKCADSEHRVRPDSAAKIKRILTANVVRRCTVFSKHVESYMAVEVKYDIDPLMEDVVLKCVDSERRIMPDRVVKENNSVASFAGLFLKLADEAELSVQKEKERKGPVRV